MTDIAGSLTATHREVGSRRIGAGEARTALRLSPGENGETVLELEHASVAKVFITSDPETGTWGIGPGWEAPLDYLGKFLRGELPDAPAAEWWEPTPEDEELGNWRGHAWAAVIEAALTAGRTDMTSAQERT